MADNPTDLIGMRPIGYVILTSPQTRLRGPRRWVRVRMRRPSSLKRKFEEKRTHRWTDMRYRGRLYRSSAYPPTYLSVYLPTYLLNYLPTDLPNYLLNILPPHSTGVGCLINTCFDT